MNFILIFNLTIYTVSFLRENVLKDVISLQKQGVTIALYAMDSCLRRNDKEGDGVIKKTNTAPIGAK